MDHPDACSRWQGERHGSAVSVGVGRSSKPGARRGPILEDMVVDVAVQALIPYPRDVVASYAGDPGNAPEWYANIVSVSWRTPPPVAVGSRMDFEARFLGRTLRYTYEVVDLQPGQRLVMRTAEGPFPMETTYTWESVPGGTLMRLRNQGAPSGFAKVASPVMAKAMKHAMTQDLARLADRLDHR